MWSFKWESMLEFGDLTQTNDFILEHILSKSNTHIHTHTHTHTHTLIDSRNSLNYLNRLVLKSV